MKEIKKEDISQEVFDLFDDHVHHRLNTRDFEHKLSDYPAGELSVESLLSLLMLDYQGNIQVKPADPGVKSEYITYQTPKGDGEIKALLSMPVNSREPLPGIIVVHENRGLNPHIEDVARGTALSGFITIAPDALSPLGGYPGTDDAGREMHTKRTTNEMLEDFIAAFSYLKNYEKFTGKIGVVGFCFGGTIANLVVVRLPDLSAVVPFYRGQPPLEEVYKIKAPLLLHYAELDVTYNAGWPAYKAALNASNKKYTAYFYRGTNHRVHNNTTPRYDVNPAELAWKRTVEFFQNTLT